jgi:SAM-dependent methyltransferase
VSVDSAPLDESPSADRLAREQAFHDERFTDEVRTAAGKYYTVTQASHDRFAAALAGLRAGDRVLELGCGLDDTALGLARRGVDVTAIDLSPVAVEQAAARAADEGVSEHLHATVMNAEALEFEPGTFDAVVGTGILHHLDLAVTFRQIGRVLAPTGRAVFIEPLGSNPAINLYRRVTPRMRTPDEHPLIDDDLTLARRYFDAVRVDYFNLLSLLAVPLRSTRRFPQVVDRLSAADSWLFRRLPATRSLAWTCVLELARPITSAVVSPRP